MPFFASHTPIIRSPREFGFVELIVLPTRSWTLLILGWTQISNTVYGMHSPKTVKSVTPLAMASKITPAGPMATSTLFERHAATASGLLFICCKDTAQPCLLKKSNYLATQKMTYLTP